MVLDSSALVAIFRQEPEAAYFNHLIAVGGANNMMAAPNLLETSMVMARFGAAAIQELDNYLLDAEIEIVPFTADHAAVARDAFMRYGKGRHRAGLNFGDCIAYATARLEAMPLLFKGGDFALTDIEAAA